MYKDLDFENLLKKFILLLEQKNTNFSYQFLLASDPRTQLINRLNLDTYPKQ
jgi:hypothetical protein